MLQEPTADSMAGFVVRDGLLLLGTEQSTLALESSDDTVDGAFEVDFLDELVALASGVQGGFVADVGDVCSGEARREDGELVGDGVALGEVLRETKRLQVDLEDTLAPADVAAVAVRPRGVGLPGPAEARRPETAAAEPIRGNRCVPLSKMKSVADGVVQRRHRACARRSRRTRG